MAKDGEGPAGGVIKIRPVKRLLAWRSDAGCQSHIVSNHYQETLAMAISNHNSVPAGFKEIPGYDGRYFITEHGDVWSVYKRGLMCPQTDVKHPYPWVLVMENGRAQPRTVYYLMRLTWMPLAPGEVGSGRDKWCVNHKDGNKLNNCIDNLEWTTNSENAKHAWRNGLQAVGEAKKNAFFTSLQVTVIRLRVKHGESAYSIAKEYNCAHQTIKKICRFESWKHQDHNLRGRVRQARPAF
jgi:hypothetical protein